jgi:DNA-directed RNA polymerase subunit E'/Rpb7
LEDKLKKSLEGKFMKEGFVVEGSLRVKDMSAGSVISESLLGDLQYIIMIEAEIIRIQPGTVLKGRISDTNKLGIRIMIEPLDIILAYI